jgi:hypothetical protein
MTLNKILCSFFLIALSLSLWLLPALNTPAQSRSLLFLDCRPEGGFLRLNMLLEATGGVTLQGYGAFNHSVLSLNGKASFLIDSMGNLSIPTNPKRQPPLQLAFRSLEAASRGQSRELGQAVLKDIRVYSQAVTGTPGESWVSLVPDNPLAPPQDALPEPIRHCLVANLATLRRSLRAPDRPTYGCSCSNPSLPRELLAEPSSGPAFTDWSDRTGEACRINARVEGHLSCQR